MRLQSKFTIFFGVMKTFELMIAFMQNNTLSLCVEFGIGGNSRQKTVLF